MKKTGSLLLLLLSVSFDLSAESAADIPRLSGIVNFPGEKAAVFEFTNCPCDSPRQLVLAEGQSLWGLKVLSILTDQRTVKVAVEGVPAPLTLTLRTESSAGSSAMGAIELAEASLYSVLELYGSYSGRTLLYWPFQSAPSFSINVSTTNQLEAATLLQKALAEKQIIGVADGEKFTMMVPKDQVSVVKPHAPRSAPSDGEAHSEELPRGAVAFHGTAIEQVLQIYAELVGGRFEHDGPMPMPSQAFIFLYTQSSLSKKEAIYAFDTLLEWRGIKMTRAPDGSVRAQARH